MHPSLFVGRSPEQVDEYLNEYVKPMLAKNKDILGMKAQLKV